MRSKLSLRVFIDIKLTQREFLKRYTITKQALKIQKYLQFWIWIENNYNFPNAAQSPHDRRLKTKGNGGNFGLFPLPIEALQSQNRNPSKSQNKLKFFLQLFSLIFNSSSSPFSDGSEKEGNWKNSGGCREGSNSLESTRVILSPKNS